MPRRKGSVEYNSFTKGLITEINPLNFPKDGFVSSNNFNLNSDGSAQRRLGMDYESGYALISSGTATSSGFAVGIDEWYAPEGDNTVSLLVIQHGVKLHFINALASAPSSDVKDAVNISDYISSGYRVNTSYISGKLVVTTGTACVLIFSYDVDAETVSYDVVRLKIRDLYGVEDPAGHKLTTRPLSGNINDQILYNLYNAGWHDKKVSYIPDIDTIPLALQAGVFDGTIGAVTASAGLLGSFVSQLGGKYPSRSDSPLLGIVTPNGIRVTDFNRYKQKNDPVEGVTSGHFVIDALSRGASREEEVSNERTFTAGALNEDQTVGGWSSSESYAGRVFFAGATSKITDGDDESPMLANSVLFTKTIDRISDFSVCYQKNDPTTDKPDILDTDGGVININEARNIRHLQALGSYLVVFAENGVWSIHGSTSGFTPTNYQVRRVSNEGAVGPTSIIDADGSLLYWSTSGIIMLQPHEDPRITALVTQNITEKTIQTDYNAINDVAKEFVVGAYNPHKREVRWLYNDTTTYNGYEYRNKYNRELVYNMTRGSFAPHTIQDATITAGIADYPYVAGVVHVPGYIVSIQNFIAVTDDGDIVDGSADTVIIPVDIRGRGVPTLTYLTVDDQTSTHKLTLSTYGQTDFLDWYTFDTTGVDASGSFVSGYDTLGDTQDQMDSPEITVHMERTETGWTDNGDGTFDPINPSGCQYRGRWDWTDSNTSGKWSDQSQAYRLSSHYTPANSADTYDFGHKVVSHKDTIRGSGRALSVEFATEAAKDCHILGWGIGIGVAD